MSMFSNIEKKTAEWREKWRKIRGVTNLSIADTLLYEKLSKILKKLVPLLNKSIYEIVNTYFQTKQI